MLHPLEHFKYCPRCGSDQFDINSDRSRHCQDCGLTYFANAAAAVAAIIIDHRGNILLTTRAYNPCKGSLDLPGGFADMNESAEEALARELKEELNIEIDNARYLFSIPNEYEYSGITVHTLDLFFEVTISEETKIEAHDDAEKALFYKLSDININEIGLKSIKTAIQHLQSI